MPLVDVGQLAPLFTLGDQAGRSHSLAELRGRWVILYFYPKDDTPGCTMEACQFRDTMPRFKRTKAAVLGISPDNEKAHAKFAAKYDLSFPLLADSARDAKNDPITCDAYGVWGEKMLYGRKYMGVVRTTYVIDPDGIVRHRWDKVKEDGHAADVLATLKLLVKNGIVPSAPVKSKRNTEVTEVTQRKQSRRI